jgi:hypothetical protein
MSGSTERGSSAKRRLLEFWRGVLKRRGRTRNRRATVGTRVLFEGLESRVLLSGGVEGALVDTEFSSYQDLAQAPITAEIAFLEEAHQTSLLDVSGSGDPNPEMRPGLIDGAGMREIVFFDENLADYRQLIADLERRDNNRNFEVVELKSDRNGIEQVSEILSERSNLAAVHFITHGADGQINIGSTFLNSTALQQNIDAISSWGKALTETGDILFYGCDIAAGSDGQGLLRTIADLTGADVAASDDLTGNAQSGGDWDLEYVKGSIETDVALSPEAQHNWSGVLATFTVTNTTNSGAGSLRQAMIDANANAGADSITFNIAGTGTHTIAPTSALPTITGTLIIDATTDDSFAANGNRPAIVLAGTNASLLPDIDGLVLSSTADGSVIRGLVIRDWTGDGIEIESGSANNLIVGNYLGRLTTSGTDAGSGAQNAGDGVHVLGANNTIGGTTAADRNVISGNPTCGVHIEGAGATGNAVIGNYIGTDASGATAIGNYEGILIQDGATNTRVGGAAANEGNVLSGNSYSGVSITGTGANNTLVQGNLIGTAADGSSALGNAAFGVVIWNGPSGNQIGGAVSGAGNVIAYNNRGVIVDANTINSLNNGILGNRIFANVTLGVDLYPAGVRANDSGDGDSGPNNYQNYPVLVSARTDGTQINLAGTLNSTANTSFRIEFFASATGDASGYGEAERYLGFVNVTTNGAGNASFNTFLTAPVAVGESISATATRANAGFTSFYDTSEFAQNRTATPLNSAPVNTLPGPKTAAEDTTLAITGLSVSDVDGNLSSVQLSVTHGVLGLSLAGGATISSGANDSASARLTGTQAQINAALATLTYKGSADFNGADTLAVLSMDTAGLTDTDNLAITVTAVNDAPVLLGANALSTISEDPASNPGTLVSALIAGQTLDVDAGALSGIAVTTVNNTNGSWQYSTNNGATWNAFGSPSDLSARLLAADVNTYVRFVPNANWNGTVPSGFTFRAWDRSSGTAGGTANTTTNGGTSAFSAATGNAGITVNPINDTPTGVPTIAGTLIEDQTLTAVTSGISDADGIGAFSYQWRRNGANIVGGTGSTYTLGDADVGSRISVQVSYTDGHGTNESVTSAQTAPVVNVNDAPNGVPVITGAATEDQTLTADPSGISDADGVGVMSYQWLRNGGNIAGGTGSTYTLGDADVGSRISVQVSYTDGHGTNESVTSAQTAPVVNVNDAPNGVPVITGAATEDQTLTADPSGINDADGVGVMSYQWLRNGGNIGGATTSTYTLVAVDVGTQISVQVSYTDGHGTNESVTSATVTPVANVNSIPVGVPTISGTAAEDQTLMADVSGISDADGLGAFTYLWLRNGATIAGATNSSYTLGDADVGSQIRVQVFYTDGQGTAESVTSAQTAPVANVNDAPAGVPLITGTVTEAQTLTANTGGISDADGLGAFCYQWLRNGAGITGATGSIYTLGVADVGTRISVTVSYTDGHGTNESVTSAQTLLVANVNDMPTGVPVITGAATEDQALAADTSGISDADGLGVFSYQWLRNGAGIAGGTGSTYTLGDSDVGARISVQVSYTDGHGTVESVTSAQSAAVGNVNDAPAGAPAITGTATEDQTLTADVSGISDADGLGAFTYQWLRNGATIAGATNSSYTLGDADVGSQIRVQVFYTDDQGTAESVTSAQTAPVANVNDAPVGAPAITGTATEDQSLTADVSGISDADGLGAFTYQWLRNGATIAGATNSSCTLGDADVDTQISVQVRYTDSHGTSECLTSAQTGAVANVNDAPVGVPTIPGTATEDQVLTADTTGISDGDGLGALSYQWLRDGSDIAGATGSTYTLSDADVGAQISVVVSYTDGHGTSESLTSAQTAAVNDLIVAGTVAVTEADQPRPMTVPVVSNPGTGDAGNPTGLVEPQAVPVDTQPFPFPAYTYLPLGGGGTANKPETISKEEAPDAGMSEESDAVSNQASEKEEVPTSPPTMTELASVLTAKESLPNTETARDERSTAFHKQGLRAQGTPSVMRASDYEHLRDSLDAVKQEITSDSRLSKVYLGSAIVSSIGLSVGYVVWLLRGGMLLASLLSSMPAWQFLDPLPILARKKDDDPPDDNESLESIVDKQPKEVNPNKKAADVSSDAEVKRR